MSPHLDRAAPVRPGEELPVDRLEAYLRQHLSAVAEMSSSSFGIAAGLEARASM